LTFETKDSILRREAYGVISAIMKVQPKLMGRIMREALIVWLKAHDEQAKSKPKPVSDEDEVILSRSRDIGRLLSAIFAPSPNADNAVLEDIAIDFLVLAHHPEISEDAQTSWIGLVQNLGLDPATIVAEHQGKILKSLWDAAGAPPQVRRG